MSVGTGIFLAGALLAVVALYVATKDRWNWMKIILWPLGVTVVIVTGFYLYSLIPEKPRVANSFWEIPLGVSESDVLFIKGKPTTQESDRWLYSLNNESWYSVRFLDGKAYLVVYTSINERDSREFMQGVTIGYAESDVRQKFGPPSSVAASDDGLTRIYNYKNYNVTFTLEQNKVIGLGIYNPAMAPKGLRFSPSKKAS